MSLCLRGSAVLSQTGFFSSLLALAALAAAPAGAFWGDPYERLAKELTRELGEWGGRKAAVLPFRRADGSETPGGAAAAAALETALVRGGKLIFVERSELSRVLAELKLQQTGLVPQEAALKVGRMAGAELLVTGTLGELSARKAELHAKLIRVETGELLRAARGKVPRSRPGPGGAPAPAPEEARVRVSVAEPQGRGSAARLDGRDLNFRYADQGARPVIRVTDYSDPARPEWVEVPIRYDPRANVYGEFARNFALAGRKYRLWSDLQSNLHVAPRLGWFGRRLDAEQEAVVGLGPVFRAWIADIESRMTELGLYYGPPNRKSLAYFEPLRSGAVRVSILNALGRTPPPGCVLECRYEDYGLDYAPLDVLVLKGRPGRSVPSRLMHDGAAYFRFHYSADAGEISVEKVK